MIAGGISRDTAARLRLVTPIATLDAQTEHARDAWRRARERREIERAKARVWRQLAQRLFGDAGSRAPNEAADGPR